MPRPMVLLLHHCAELGLLTKMPMEALRFSGAKTEPKHAHKIPRHLYNSQFLKCVYLHVKVIQCTTSKIMINAHTDVYTLMVMAHYS